MAKNYWNMSTTKISKLFLENSWNSINQLWNWSFFDLVWRFHFNIWRYCWSSTTICNSWYKTLCSSCTFIDPRKCKTIKSSKINFKRTTDWNKCQSRLWIQPRNQYLNYLIDPSFQGDFLFYHSKIMHIKQVTSSGFSSNCNNKWVQCYDCCKKIFWSASEK